MPGQRMRAITERKLYLFRLEQIERTGYDIYDAMIVAAYDLPRAKKIHPAQSRRHSLRSKSPWKDEADKSWASSPAKVMGFRIGVAGPSIKQPGIILKSYRAG